MKKFVLYSIVFGLYLGLMSSDFQSLPNVSNNAFQEGEKLRYRITYGFVDAGEAVLEVKSTQKKRSWQP